MNDKIIYGESRMSEGEKEFIAELIPEFGQYLEVGSLCGASTAWILDKCHSTINAVCVDALFPGVENPGITQEHYHNLILNYQVQHPRMNVFLGTLQRFNSLGDLYAFDVILLDASHGREDILKDLTTAKNMVDKLDGCILVHDYYYDRPGLVGVKEGTDDFLRENPSWYIAEACDKIAVLKMNAPPINLDLDDEQGDDQ